MARALRPATISARSARAPVWLLFDGTAWVSQPSRLSPAVGRPLAWTTSALLGQQPMTQRRPRRRRRLEQEPVFGPLVVFGSGGAATGVLGDHVTRLTPLTDADADADEMIHAVRAAPLLSGDRGVPPAVQHEERGRRDDGHEEGTGAGLAGHGGPGRQRVVLSVSKPAPTGPRAGPARPSSSKSESSPAAGACWAPGIPKPSPRGRTWPSRTGRPGEPARPSLSKSGPSPTLSARSTLITPTPSLAGPT